MAKRTFNIAPKLKEPKQELPVQELSVDRIKEIVKETQEGSGSGSAPVPKPKAKSTRPKAKKAGSKKKKTTKPQGRPRRAEPVKRISSDLPEDVYMRMKREINRNGYTMNGFLARVLREYFERIDKK